MDASSAARLRAHLTVTATAVVLVLSLLPGTALADHSPNDGDPCREATPATFFADYDRARQVHRASVDCAVYRAITSGAGTNAHGQPVYRPQAAVTRGQMAQFIVNTLVAAGHDAQLPSGGGEDRFDDIGASFARVAINRLARAGIIGGTGNGAYSPGAPISRQQMASFITQAANWAVNPDVGGDGNDRFTDVSATNVHQANIEAGADAGLFQGTGATTFAPGRLVVRDQMATFLINLLRHAFDAARAPTPYTASVAIDDTTVNAGQDITGQITGSNVRSVVISGCGIASQALADRDPAAAGIQYRVQVPVSQPAGTCTLSFTVTFTNGRQRTSSIQMSVGPANQATVTVDQSSVKPGGQITGQITGSNVASARLSGCGLNDEPAEDRNGGQAGIQFTETIPSSQPHGTCTLTFTVMYVDNRTEERNAQLTIGAPPGATTRPELVQAAVVSTTTTAQASSTNPAGTVVRYSFDEAVTSPAAARFFVYRDDAGRIAADPSGAQVEGSGSSVLVRFSGINTPALAAELTTATVDDAAATDAQGQTNPEGAVALGSAAARPAGITAAPDLVSAGPLRVGTAANTTAVDLTFDEAAFTVTPAGFHLVLTDNTIVNCSGPARESTAAGGGGVAGGNGTTHLTAVCPNPAGTTLTTSNVARAYADAQAVSDVRQSGGATSGTTNPLQSAALAAGGATSGPDLQSILLAAGAGANDPDIVIFSFDDNLEEAVSANRFVIYDTAGREFSGVTAARQGGGGANRRGVTVTFSAEALDAAAGASLRAGAVSAGTAPNRPDELGIAGPTPTGTPGVTAAPDLVGVALATSGTGASQVTTATYTFDEDLEATSGASHPGRFLLYLGDGTRLTCSGTSGSTFVIGTSGSARRQATCSSFQAVGAAATPAQIAAAVLGTVDHAAVDDADAGAAPNPEGAVRSTGGTGTPQQ